MISDWIFYTLRYIYLLHLCSQFWPKQFESHVKVQTFNTTIIINIGSIYVRFVWNKPDYLYNIYFSESMRKYTLYLRILSLINVFPIYKLPHAPLIKSFSYQLPWKYTLARRTACIVLRHLDSVSINYLIMKRENFQFYHISTYHIPIYIYTIARQFNQFHIMFRIVNYSLALMA